MHLCPTTVIKKYYSRNQWSNFDHYRQWYSLKRSEWPRETLQLEYPNVMYPCMVTQITYVDIPVMMFFWYCSFDMRTNATAMYSVPLLFSKHFWVQITLYGHSADSWPQTKSLFLFLTQEKNIFLNTNADSVIQGNHTRSNNSILLNTILLTCHSSHDVVRHGMPVALWSSTLLPALILLDKATSILHTRHVHLPFVRACHLYSNHPIYKS